MKCGDMINRRRDPFAAIRREFERGLPVQNGSRFGAMTAYREGDGYYLEFDLPGLTEDQIAVTYEDDTLTISGDRAQNIPEGASLLHNTRQSGQFQRSLKFDETIDPDSIDAVLESGVLAVRLSKRADLKPRSISVRPATKS